MAALLQSGVHFARFSFGVVGVGPILTDRLGPFILVGASWPSVLNKEGPRAGSGVRAFFLACACQFELAESKFRETQKGYCLK